LLREFDASIPERTVERMERLTRGSAGSIEAMINVLVAGTAGCLEGSPVAWDGTIREILLTTLEGHDEAVLDLVRARRANPTPPERRAWIQLLGRCGGEAELNDLLEIASSTDTAAPHPLDTELEDALARLLQRSPSACPALVHGIFATNAARQELLRRALGASGSPPALNVLVRLLEDPRSPRRVLLEQIDRIVRSLPTPAELHHAEIVRPFLRDAAEDVLAAAASAAGGLRDERAVPRLIELLRSPPGQVRGKALESLRRISGHSFSADPGRWSLWHEEEQAWWAHRSRRAFEVVNGGERQELVATLREMCALRLRRDELVERLVQLLADDDPGLRAMTCHVFAQLGSPAAVPALIERLSDVESTVANAAHGALGTLTRLDLPPEPAVWLAATENPRIRERTR
jgi:HEAT repeat protein